MQYLVDRLSEFSTWRGLALLGAAVGIVVSPADLMAYYSVFVALVGAYNAVTKG